LDESYIIICLNIQNKPINLASPVFAFCVDWVKMSDLEQKPPDIPSKLRGCLYGGEPARVPELARFAELISSRV
jgi:hypothetical protein